MKKNLKKVISAVLSLTLALSSFVALSATTSAATFTDVADTANYSEAVEALVALGIVSGYGDGTFMPNKNVTRAETITMVVGALNMSEDAKNSSSTTKFTDVNEQAAWSAGYVNIGVAQNLISGVSKTEFSPNTNVTYGQILTILTSVLGYKEYLGKDAVYPDDYINAAKTAGILSGVTASADDDMTRAQVAQLIWNTMQAPMLDVTTFSASAEKQELQKMDGNNGKEFRTVLSQYFNAYVMNVTVDSTSQTEGNGTVNKIGMTLIGSNDWDPEYEVLLKNYGTAIAASAARKTDVDAGATAAADYLFSSAKVIAEYVDDDWTLLYFAPTAKVATKTIDGTLVPDTVAAAFNTNAKTGVTTYDELKIKKSSTTSSTTTYKLSASTDVYVNGYKYATLSATTASAVRDLLAGSVGDVTLVEDTTTANKYNKIMINYYVFARVSQVNSKTDSITITLAGLKAPENVVSITSTGSSVTVDYDEIESGEVVVNVAKAGQAAELASLAKDDVIAVKYDINGKIEDSNVIEILATNDVVTGKYTGYDDDEELYTVAGTDYEATADLTSGISVGTTYTFKLDPMGRLFSYEEEATSKNFAIVERYAEAGTANNSGEYDLIQVVTFDGQAKTLYIDPDSEGTVGAALTSMNIKTTVDATAKAINIQDRVVEYTVKASTGRVRTLTPVTGADIVVYDATAGAVEYNSTTNRLGKAIASTAAVLDATTYMENKAVSSVKNKVSDYQASSLSALSDGVKYEAILVHKNSSNEYNNVIITRAGSTFGASSNFAVAAVDAKDSSRTYVEEDEVYRLKVMENGSDKATDLNVSLDVEVYVHGVKQTSNSTAKAIEKVKEGSVFYYTTDSDGYVKKLDVVFAITSFADLYKTVSANISNVVTVPAFGSQSNVVEGGAWKVQLADFKGTGANDIQLVLAPVCFTNDKSITVGEIELDSASSLYYIDTNKTHDYTINDETKVYSYDMSGKVKAPNCFSVGSFLGFDASDVDANGKAWLGQKLVSGSKTDYEYDHSQTIQMAFLMVVDGAVTNALVIQNF